MHPRRKIRLLLFLLTIALNPAAGRATANQTLTVGTDQSTCPNATFSQIQPAIDQATPGDSIHVCPGVYLEQPTIAKSLSIIADSGAFIVPPVFEQNATSLASGAPIAAGILVTGADSVSISGLTLDGINNSITECSPRLEGIYYQNASGKVDHVVVTNTKLGVGLNGCQSGTGILIESGGGGNSNVEITNCQIHGFQKNGITANEIGTVISVHGNTITGLGPTTGAAQNGIQVGFGASGKILHNTVTNMVWSPCVDANTCQAVATNILIANSDGVEVNDNTAITSQIGIFAVGNNEDISRNRISNALVFDGVRVVGNETKIIGNTISNASESLIFLQGNENEVIHNTLSDSLVGILKMMPSSDDKFRVNDFDNVLTPIVDPLPLGPTDLIAPER